MTDAPEDKATPDPTQLREEVEEELDGLVAAAATDERKRMAERDTQGIDEPSDPPS